MEENTKYILLGVGVLLLVLVLFAFQGGTTTTTQTGSFLMGDSTRYIAPEDNVTASLTGGATSGTTIINNIFDTNGGTTFDGLALVSATDINAGYLLGKLVAGTNISFTQQNIGGNEILEINVDSLTSESDPYYTADASTIVYDGDDISDLTNDSNYQSYDDVLGFGFLTSVDAESDPVFVANIPNIIWDGNDVSRLVNDANYISGSEAYSSFQLIGEYLSSIPNYVIMDTNNASRLTNDLNWQSYDAVQNLISSSVFTLPSGIVFDTNGVSILNNDVNYQTFTNVSDLIDGVTFTLPSGLVWDSNGVSILTNDSNYQTYTNIIDFNYITGTDAYDNFQIKGSYLTSFTESDPVYLADVSNIVFDGNNVSRLVNDANYQDYDDVVNLVAGVTFTLPSGIVFDTNNVSILNNDVNYQSYDDVLGFGFLTSVDAESDPVFVANIPNIIWDGNDVSRLVNDANYISGSEAYSSFQLIGDYLSSIPNYVIMDTNNASRLTNDLNWQSYDAVQNLISSSVFTLPSGIVFDTNGVSILNNDVNYQTFTNVSDLIDGVTFTLPSGLVWDSNGVSILTNDSNYQTYTNVLDFNYITGTDAYDNFQIKGSYLTSFTESDPVYLADVSNIVFDGNNVSRLVNDANYQDYDDVVNLVAGVTFTLPSGLVFDTNGVSILNNDVNYQSYDDVLGFGFLTSVDAESDPVFVANIPNIIWDGNDVSRLVNDANYISGSEAYSSFQLIGEYLSSIPNYVIMDTNNASRLTNDLNWQSYDAVQNLISSSVFTLPSGLVWDSNGVSILNNDVNYQTFTNVSDLIDGVTFTLPSGLVWDSNGVSILTNDSNYQTYTNVLDFNYITGIDAYDNFQIKGSYLTSFTESDPVYLADVSNIVFDGNNVSRLVNDANYQDYDDVVNLVAGVTFTLPSGLVWDSNGVSILNNDVNYQTDADVIAFISDFVSTGDLSSYALAVDVNSWGDARYQPLGSYLTSISGLNISDLVNDSNYQSYDDVLGFGFLTSFTESDPVYLADVSNIVFDGNNVSRLVNDVNYQTDADVIAFISDFVSTGDLSSYALAVDVNSWGDARYQPLGSYLTSISGLNISDLVNDSNYQSYDDVLGFGFLTSFTESDPVYLADVSNIVFDGNNVSRLVNDVNYQTDADVIAFISDFVSTGDLSSYALAVDVNSWGDARYLPLNTVIPVDTNWQTSFTAFDTNMKGQFREYTVDLNTTANVGGNNLIADANIYVGDNGYIYDNGTELIIGRR